MRPDKQVDSLYYSGIVTLNACLSTGSLEKIAYNLGRKDENPNIELAVELCNSRNVNGIREIAQGLNNTVQGIANDCIKVLYEIGERNPELIAEYVTDFIRLLNSNNNRLIWGAMTALSKITSLKPQIVFKNLDVVLKAYRKGSVIIVDNSISVLAELSKCGKEYEKAVFPYIIKHLEACRPKEVAQHAERASVCVNKNNSDQFMAILLKRKTHLTDAQRKRIDMLIKKINLL